MAICVLSIVREDERPAGDDRGHPPGFGQQVTVRVMAGTYESYGRETQIYRLG